MYQFSYAEMQDDDATAARATDRSALLHCVELLRAAKAAGPNTRPCVDALAFLTRLWTLFLEDLAGEGNGLPGPLRADLISIGLWLLREAEAIRLERSDNFDGLIDISAAIADGLAR